MKGQGNHIYIGFLVLFIFLTVFQGCKPTQGPKIPADFELTMSYVGCRGYCPAYEINLDATGKATYEGKRAVEKIGLFQKTLTKSSLKAIIKTIREAYFFDFSDHYGEGVADVQTIIIDVTLDGRSKRVTDTMHAPKQLKELEAKLETMIGPFGWTQVR